MAKIKIDRGTTFTLGVVYEESDGTARTLVGATVRFTMKSDEWDTSTNDTTAVVTKNVTTGTAEGTATITINPADTSTLTPGKYFYDIKVQEADGSVFKIDEGTITLDGSPTNRLV